MPTTQQSKQGGLSGRKRHKKIKYDMEMSIKNRAEISENSDQK